jgi:hypothetical protein
MISVTSEPLGHITSRMKADSSLLASAENPAWTVSLLDLLMITECLEDYAPWFPHYIRRRIRILTQGRFSSGDELDYFMVYLLRGLYYEDISEFRDEDGRDADEIMLGSFTDPLDHYYFYRMGLRKKPAPRPVPSTTPEFRRFIERLEISALPRRLEAVMSLLDLSSDARRAWLSIVAQVRKRVKKDGAMHDGSMVGSAGLTGWGLTYVCGKGTREELERTLRPYVDRKRREMFADKWVGIGDAFKGPVACIATSRRVRARP